MSEKRTEISELGEFGLIDHLNSTVLIKKIREQSKESVTTRQ